MVAYVIIHLNRATVEEKLRLLPFFELDYIEIDESIIYLFNKRMSPCIILISFEVLFNNPINSTDELQEIEIDLPILKKNPSNA